MSAPTPTAAPAPCCATRSPGAAPRPSARTVDPHAHRGRARPGHGRPRAVGLRHRAQPGRAPPGGDGPAGRRPLRHPVAPRPGPRSAAAAPSRSARRAPAGPARARPARPQWAGGGVALGPKPRSYAPAHPQEDDPPGPAARPCRTGPPSGQVVVVDAWRSRRRAPRTPSPPWPPSGSTGRVLVVLGHDERRRRALLRQPARRPDHRMSAELNAYDILRNDWVVFTDAHPARGADADAEPRPTPPRGPARRRAPGGGRRPTPRPRPSRRRRRGRRPTSADDRGRGRRQRARRPTPMRDAMSRADPPGRLGEVATP